jgi:hypothetical protein
MIWKVSRRVGSIFREHVWIESGRAAVVLRFDHLDEAVCAERVVALQKTRTIVFICANLKFTVQNISYYLTYWTFNI